jgi:hypothetical protein
MTRLLVFASALVFIAGFGFLTVATVIRQGLTAGTVVSAFVLVLLTIGIVGALLHPPRE